MHGEIRLKRMLVLGLRLFIGLYHFDTAHRPQTLIQHGLFNSCSPDVQN
jgi:hypothetical protein